MAKPKLSNETRIKVIVILKLLKADYSKESELHKAIAGLLNEYENEEVTQPRVAAIHTQSKLGRNTPYEKYDWQLSLSKSVFKGFIEENKSVLDKLLDVIIRSKITKNDITKESFENLRSELLVCFYYVLSFLQQGSDWKTATEQTAKLLNFKSGQVVARKCGKEFGGGPGQGGGVSAFIDWFRLGVMLDKLQEKIPDLSENDYEIFRELLS